MLNTNNSCDYCDFCYFCNYCYFCKKLKMTEYNLFCYAEKYNDENSFQQKSYRAFNKKVGKDRYDTILETVRGILGSPDQNLSDFWKQVTSDQWNELLAIPEAKDFKKGFEFISGVKLPTDKVEIIFDGKEFWISKESAEEFKNQFNIVEKS